MCGRAVHGPAIESKVMLIGQAPGVHEESRGRPFAHTAGKTLFKWLKEATGAEEDEIRELIYFSAVARCFPGKAKSGSGDRPPSPEEIQNCQSFLAAEVQALKPRLILAVGKVAVAAVFQDQPESKLLLTDLVGRLFKVRYHGVETRVLPLPHPSGASPWPHTPEGREKLGNALRLLRREYREYCS